MSQLQKAARSLLFGSATALTVLGGAQATDLPTKAKAVEYVKVCSIYGAVFYYIPGTDTCLKLGGYLRIDVVANANGIGTGVLLCLLGSAVFPRDKRGTRLRGKHSKSPRRRCLLRA